MTESPSRPLADLLAGGPLPYDSFLDLSIQIAAYLENLHARGFVHGNLDTQSIHVDSEGRIDFPELATPPAATAEAIAGDLLAAGNVCAQMLGLGGSAGDPPIHPILSEDMPLDSPTNLIPVETRLLMEELLSENPKERIKSAHELVSTLRELKTLQSMPLEPSTPGGGDKSRLYLAISLTALGLIVIWVILGIISRP